MTIALQGTKTPLTPAQAERPAATDEQSCNPVLDPPRVAGMSGCGKTCDTPSPAAMPGLPTMPSWPDIAVRSNGAAWLVRAIHVFLHCNVGCLQRVRVNDQLHHREQNPRSLPRKRGSKATHEAAQFVMDPRIGVRKHAPSFGRLYAGMSGCGESA